MSEEGDQRGAKQEIGYLELLRNFPDFRKLFLARTVSLLGDWFNLIALLALLREKTAAGPEVIGSLFIIKLLPNFVAGFPAGVVADRFNRKGILIASDLFRFFMVAAIFSVEIFPARVVPIIFILTALQIGSSSFFEAARSASVPNLVSAAALPTANALGAATWSTMFTLGVGLGGVVTELAGWRFALVVDALTFLVSASLILLATIPQFTVRRSPVGFWQWTGLEDIRLGFLHVRERGGLVLLLFLKSAWCLAGGAVFILTLYGERRYHFGHGPNIGISVLMTMRAMGTGFGPVLARSFTGNDQVKMRLAVRYGFFAGAGFYIIFSFISNPYLACLFVFLAHMGGSTVWVFSTVLLQLNTADEYRGRIFAADLGLATAMISMSIYFFRTLAVGQGLELEHLPRILGLVLLFPALLWTVVGAPERFSRYRI